MLKCSHTFGSSATAAMMRSVMSFGYEGRNRTRAIPSIASMPSNSVAKSASPSRSWPYASTVCPSSVTSRTPRAARWRTSARIAPADRDASRPRRSGTMQ